MRTSRYIPGGHSTGRRAGSAALVAAAVALAVAACSSGGSGSSAPPAASTGAASSTGASASAAPAPAKDVATGTPIVFGYVNDDSGAAAAFPDETAGTKATVAYINNYMGGINGHPIQVYYCSDDGTPSAAGSCATQVLQHNPVAIIGGADLATTASVPLFEQAGKPYLGGVAFAGPENTEPLSFQFNGGDTGDWAVMGMYSVQDLHAKNIAIVYPENGVAVTAAELSKEVAVKMGLSASNVELIGQSATAPDSTPAMEAAERNRPDVIIGITTGTQCLSLAQAHQELGIQAPLILPGGCMSTTQIKDGGSSYQGVLSESGAAPNSPQWASNPQILTFLKALQLYSPQTSSTGFATDAFQTVMDIRQVLDAVKGPITTAAIVSAFRSTTSEANWIGPNYDCKNPPIKAVPALCTIAGEMYKVENGVNTLVSGWLNPGPYITSVPGIS
jgi:branched-chain amino acid transport system substrate-binding protein